MSAPNSNLRFLIGGIVLASLAGAGWYFFIRSPAEPESVGQARSLYLYCDECGLELPCPPGQENETKLCSRCGSKRNVMKIYFFSHAAGGAPPRPTSDWFVGTVLATPLFLALALVAVRWAQSGKETKEEESASYTTLCKTCSHGIRYKASQARQRTICPACQTEMILPSPGGQSSLLRWTRGLKDWQEKVRDQLKRQRKPRT